MKSMSSMIDMSRPKPVVEETKVAAPSVADSYYEKYPWGLRLTLNDEDVKRLGVDISDFTVENVGELKARFIVTSVSSEQNIDHVGAPQTRDRLELQITAIQLVDVENFEAAFKEAVDEE